MLNQIYFISGYDTVTLNEEYLKHLSNAGNFYLSKLLPRHKTLEIEISVTKDLDDKARGYSLQESTKIFSIELKIQDLVDMLLTLAHELVHVKQMIKGEELCENEAYEKEYELYRMYIEDMQRI